MKIIAWRRLLLFTLLWLGGSLVSVAQIEKELPARPSPQRLVNDLAGMMTPAQQETLERQLVEFDNTTSSQVAVVTVPSLNDHDVAEYAIALFNKWGIGRKGKNNGILIFASSGDRKMWIVTGQGMEGALTDAQAGRIVRNEMVPEFKAGNYYNGFDKAAKAVIAATKGEYTNENPPGSGEGGGFVPFLILFIIIVIIIVAAIRGGGKGGGGGNYMSRRGGDFITGAILGSIFSGGGSGSSGGSWGGGSSGGGGFGGFGGGYSGGGGAGGSW